MSKRRITYIHLFIWMFAIFANIPYYNLTGGIPTPQLIGYVIAFLYLMVVFYLFYIVLTPLFLNRKKIIEFFLFSFIIVLIMPFFGYTLLFLSRAYFNGSFENFYRGYSFKMHMSGYFPVLTAAVFGSFFRTIINWYTTMSQKADLDKQKLAIELDLLKSKLNPHFLFNTLNNIDSLIHSNPEEASVALIRLSEIMRYMTYETSAEYLELGREVEYLRNFIELYRIRIKSPGNILFEASGNMSVKIAPALFVPLIENCFKFGSIRNQGPSVEIHLSSENGIVNFYISNYFEKNIHIKAASHSGYGISNLKKRLELTYPDKFKLIIDQGSSVYKVKLTIDTNGN